MLWTARPRHFHNDVRPINRAYFNCRCASILPFWMCACVYSWTLVGTKWQLQILAGKLTQLTWNHHHNHHMIAPFRELAFQRTFTICISLGVDSFVHILPPNMANKIGECTLRNTTGTLRVKCMFLCTYLATICLLWPQWGRDVMQGSIQCSTLPLKYLGSS